MLMARFMTGKGLVVHIKGNAQGRPLSETDSNALAKEFLQENACYLTLKRYSNKFQYRFEMSQQIIWTEVLKASSKTTSDTSLEEKGRKDGNVLFNEALNTFYLRLYCVRHMVKDHSESGRHLGYYFRLTSRVILYAPSHRQDNTYHGLCYTVVEHWLEREIAQWVHSTKDRSDDPSHHERTLLL